MDEYTFFQKKIEIDYLKEKLRLSILREENLSQSLNEELKQKTVLLESKTAHHRAMADVLEESKAYRKEADKHCAEKISAHNKEIEQAIKAVNMINSNAKLGFQAFGKSDCEQCVTNKKLSEITSELSATKSSFNKKSSEVKKLSKNLETSQFEVFKLKTKLENTVGQHDRKFADLKTSYEEKYQECAVVKQLSELESKLFSTKVSFDEQSIQLDQLKRISETRLSEISTLKNTVEKLKFTCKEYKKKVLSNEKTLSLQKTKLHAQMIESKAKTPIEDKNPALEKLKVENENLKQNIADLHQALADKRMKHAVAYVKPMITDDNASKSKTKNRRK